MASEAGKGSGRRPSEVSMEQFDNNWDRIFGKKERGLTKVSTPIDESAFIEQQAPVGVESTPLYNPDLCKEITATATKNLRQKVGNVRDIEGDD